MFPSTGSAGRRFASLHRVLRGEFPCFSSTIKALRLPAPIPPHFVSFAWRYLSVSLVVFAPRRTSAPPGPGVGHPVSPAGSRRGNDRTSQVPGEPQLSVCTCSSDAGRTARTRPVHSAAAWPSVYEQRRLPRKVFRRSIAWLSDSLCTLRSAGYPRPTQHSLPAAGQALPDGLSTRRIPMKGFRSDSYISSPSPKLLAALISTERMKPNL